MPRAKHVCIACSSQIQQLHTALNCEECNRWQHLRCGTGISQSFYWKVVRCLGVFEWSCSACRTTQSEGNETLQISPQPKRRCSRLDGDGFPTNPPKRRRPASIPSQSVAPVSSRPAAPVSSRPAAPVISQPAAPVSSQPAAPVSSQPAAPVSSRPAAPVISKPAAPVSSQPAAPVSSQPAAPVISQPAATVSSQPAAPVSSQSAAPVISQPAAPVSSQFSAPVSSQPTTPVSSRPTAPVSSRSTAPVPSRSTAPVSSRSTAPVSSQHAAPVISQPTAPVYSRPTAPVSSRPAAPVSSRPAAPVSSRPAAPVSSRPTAPVSSQHAAAISSSVPDSHSESLKFYILEKGSNQGFPLLLSSDGYDYHAQTYNRNKWRCSLRTCRTFVDQDGDTFKYGPRKHCHPARPFLRLSREMALEARVKAVKYSDYTSIEIAMHIYHKAPKNATDIPGLGKLSSIVESTRQRLKIPKF